MQDQPCERCGRPERAVNYRRGDRVYYRRVCNGCAREQKQQRSLETQLLQRSGYKKRPQCNCCGFRSKVSSQMQIIYLDGNRHNAALSNLRSYCLNCIEELKHTPANRRHQPLADY